LAVFALDFGPTTEQRPSRSSSALLRRQGIKRIPFIVRAMPGGRVAQAARDGGDEDGRG
jgi:hypothetical protein